MTASPQLGLGHGLGWALGGVFWTVSVPRGGTAAEAPRPLGPHVSGL